MTDYKNNRVVQTLGITYPIVQAPMNWITDAHLVAAVSNAGGLGVLGPNAGQTSLTTDIGETIDRMRAEIRKTKALTARPFGLNFVITTPPDAPVDAFVAGFLQLAFEEGITHYVTVGNANGEVFRQIKAHKGIIIHRPLTPSVAAMQEAERLGADVLVATGYDEGGILPQQVWGTFTVVPAMADAVSIPVLGAGGVNDTRGVKAMFALGAEGVYVGTRFIATAECPSPEVLKQKILQSGYKDIVKISATQRSLKTNVAERLAALYNNPDNTTNTDAEVRKLGGMLPAMRLGKIEEGTISTNTGIDIIKDIPTVAELIERLFN